ncbi:ATP-binding protein [Acuticoccus sp. M5D2P5]|uniref:ATP-binding protein n=1 Tax=Acuticoccus kalidii TaxID=2910977 RepID=UPI001F393027|nr:ATP-binding protein [Acuticoccus kalidii]MCF3932729.1 ATP-binding protein [Acuticoccus kalidii]
MTLSAADDLDRMVEAIEAFGDAEGLPLKTVMTLNLIFEEIVTNVINHGSKDGSATIEVTALRSGDLIEGTVRDDGTPFDPLARQSPDTTASLEEREIGGLGVHLVRTMSQDLHYMREGRHNVLRFAIGIEEG